ncbi:MAG: hypothetical protein ACJ8AO_10250, partial [Gemmatimonadaceae bacterium]
RLITEPWDTTPSETTGVWGFHFHPSDLAGGGADHFVRNVQLLRERCGAEFLVASAVPGMMAAAA